MKNRKQRQVICLLLLVLMLAPMLFLARAEGEVTARELLTEMGELIPVQKTPYLLAKERKGTQWGVYNTDGEELIPYSYVSLNYLSCNCFDATNTVPGKRNASVPPTLEEFNSHALVTADGTQVSDFQYAIVQAFTPYWACGLVLEEGTENNYDYVSADSFYYLIRRCDLFYLGDHALLGKKGTEELPPCLSLTRDQFKDAKGHGKYLYVQDRQDQFTVYDSEFHQMDIEIKKLDEAMYTIKNWAVIDRGTSEILLDGYSAVQEVTTDAGLLLKVTRLDYSGKKWNGVFSLEGEELMPLIQAEIAAVTPDYAVLTANKKQGLYSFRENKQLIPCEYDKVIATDTSLDPYVLHGYSFVENQGKRYYLRIADGTAYETASLSKKWTKVGAAYVLNDGSQTRFSIWPPDQIERYVDDAKLVKGQNRGSGYLLSVTSEFYKNMVVTWDGDRVLKFYSNVFTITDDDKVIVETLNDGYKLFEIVTEE